MPTKITKKQKILYCGAILAVMLTVWMTFVVTKKQDTFPRLEINGNKISREEYSWAMYAARNAVLSEHAASGISPVQWQEETALGMPCEMVAEHAVQILREYYAVVTLAQERGYLTDGSFAALRLELEEENRQRAAAMSAGEIFTGLTAYDLERYISYRIDGLRRQFCDDANNPEMAVTQEEILQRYEADKGNLYTMEDSLELRYLAVHTQDMTDDAVADLKKDMEFLRQQVTEGISLQTAVEQLPHVREFYQEISVDGSNYAMYARGYGDVLAFSADLQTGDISRVIVQEDRIFLIECAAREEKDFYSLEDVSSVVQRSIQQDRYDTLIAERVQQMAASFNPDALYRYTANMLG